MHDYGNMLEKFELLNIQEVAATGADTGLDMAEYLGTLKVMLSARDASGSSPTLAVKLQESDSVGSGYTDVTSGAFTQVTTADSFQELVIDTRAIKRYLRAFWTVGGSSTPKFLASVVGVGAKRVGG
jgi:hypothetical protein